MVKIFYIIYYSLRHAVAANTGFSAFPVLAYNLAKDKFMPHMYMDRGDRLGYSNGILTLAAGSIVLLLIFQGSTERLIPLYSIGVFIPFALSQSGMVVKWRKLKIGCQNQLLILSAPLSLSRLSPFCLFID